MTYRTLFLFFIALSFGSIAQIPAYNLKKATASDQLPDTLREISDITVHDSVSFACVQDENGIIFIYNWLQHKVTEQKWFGPNGDYEGIASVNGVTYVLRSDGVLFATKESFNSLPGDTKTYTTGIPAEDNEGLFYDKEKNRLLIGCKSKIGKGTRFKDYRFVYSFDLATKKLSPKPVFSFYLPAIKNELAQKNIILPVKVTQKGTVTEAILKFATSALAIHPITKTLYLISSTDRILFEFDMQGKLLNAEQLDESLFNKPEGITFLENGDLFISNEGEDKKPTLLKFAYNKL